MMNLKTNWSYEYLNYSIALKNTDFDTLVSKDIDQAKYRWRKAATQRYADASYSLQQVYD